jgi:hypothetical protein
MSFPLKVLNLPLDVRWEIPARIPLRIGNALKLWAQLPVVGIEKYASLATVFTKM